MTYLLKNLDQVPLGCCAFWSAGIGNQLNADGRVPHLHCSFTLALATWPGDQGHVDDDAWPLDGNLASGLRLLYLGC